MKRARYCSECGRSIHLTFSKARGNLGRLRRHGSEQPDHHDLCDRCYRSLRARVVAARMQRKPRWVEHQRATLVQMGLG